MSKGNPKIIVRIPPELIDLMDLAIASRNLMTRDEIWTRSDWLRKAILEKLKHIKRSRAKRKAKIKTEQAKESGVES